MKSKSKKIKICFIQTYVYPLFNDKNDSIHGGSELQLYLIAKELSKDKNFEISFIVGDFGQEDVEIFDDVKLYNSVTPKECDSKIKKLRQVLVYHKLFKRINADIYFTSAANSTVGLVSLFCKLNNKKHIHRTANETEVNLSYSKKGILGKIFIKGLETSDLVITQNETHKKLLKRNHGIDSKVFNNSFVIKANDVCKKTSILWIARCIHWKRPELFMRLAEYFPEEKFIMIAPPAIGKENYQREIKEKTDKIENLTFIDHVPFNDIQKYFDDAKVFVNTSEYEGFPNTFLQAGVGKTPILSLNVNPDNFINKYDCGFCCDGDFDKLKKYAMFLVNNNVEWNEKSENVFKYVVENHNICKNIECLKKLIYRLVKL